MAVSRDLLLQKAGERTRTVDIQLGKLALSTRRKARKTQAANKLTESVWALQTIALCVANSREISVFVAPGL